MITFEQDGWVCEVKDRTFFINGKQGGMRIATKKLSDHEKNQLIWIDTDHGNLITKEDQFLYIRLADYACLSEVPFAVMYWLMRGKIP